MSGKEIIVKVMEDLLVCGTEEGNMIAEEIIDKLKESGFVINSIK